jgi:release factor glutamine methyltransferase
VRPSEVIRRGATYLERHGVASPQPDAERLMERVLGLGRSEVFARTDPLSAHEARAFGRALCRRCTGTPLQHLTGEQGFRRIVVEVRPGVFVPRPETEVVVEEALARVDATAAPLVVDLCTGSGAIALAVKDERPDARVIATDVSADSVALARANAARLSLDVDVREGDLFDPLPPELRGDLDVVVANPPYVPADRAPALPADVRADPALALFGDAGLLERLVRDAFVWLRPGGALVLEIDDEAGDATREVVGRVGFVEVTVLPDLNGRDRVCVATEPDVA